MPYVNLVLLSGLLQGRHTVLSMLRLFRISRKELGASAQAQPALGDDSRKEGRILDHKSRHV